MATKRSAPQAVDAVAVYVRVRPMLAAEAEAGEAAMPGLATSDHDSVAIEPTAARRAAVDGFSGVFGPASSNRDVFARAFSSRVAAVLAGGTASFFSYGYTGGGKTHSVLGCGTEEGVYPLAADQLLSGLRAQDSSLLLRASAFEVYGDEVLDLCNGGGKCTLRTDMDGSLLVMGPKRHTQLADMFDIPNLAGRFVVTQSQGVSSEAVRTTEDALAVLAKVRRQRATGASTVNSQSSRSHAVLRLDVVSEEVLAAQGKLDTLKAAVPSLMNAMDEIRKVEGEGNHELYAVLKKCLRHAQSDARAATEELGQALARAPPAVGGAMVCVDLAGADYDSRDVGAAGHTAEQKKESIDINKSLLALKECFRALAQPQGKIPFRDSKLTRMLEAVLCPVAVTHAGNAINTSVMLVNVSPVAGIEKATVNALRYGQMFSKARRGASAGASAGGGACAARVIGGSKLCAQKRGANAAVAEKENTLPRAAELALSNAELERVREEVRHIYACHCTEKTADEVDEILTKFQGREKDLFVKVKAKYVPASVVILQSGSG